MGTRPNSKEMVAGDEINKITAVRRVLQAHLSSSFLSAGLFPYLESHFELRVKSKTRKSVHETFVHHGLFVVVRNKTTQCDATDSHRFVNGSSHHQAPLHGRRKSRLNRLNVPGNRHGNCLGDPRKCHGHPFVVFVRNQTLQKRSDESVACDVSFGFDRE